MRQTLISAIVAAIVAAIVGGVVVSFADVAERDTPVAASGDGVGGGAASPGLSLAYTDELPEDVWVDGARTPGSDRRSLADASNSICYVTKLEIGGVQGPEDVNSCAVRIDDFTGFWELIATVEEGGRSQVHCNARCLVWE